MPRYTMRRLQDNLDAARIGNTGLGNDQFLKRRILEREFAAMGNPAIEAALQQQHKLIAQSTAAKSHAVGAKKTRKGGTQPRRKDYQSPEGFNLCGVVSGRSYASRTGELMEAKQKGFPDVMRHPTTIHNLILRLTGDAGSATEQCRPRFRDAFANLSPGSQVSGRFQIALKTAEYLASIFPEAELPDFVDPVHRPDELFALLHWHGVIADPHLTKQEVRRIITKAFPGCRRVCVSKVQPERINEHGETTHGGQGFLEYACLEKTEIKFSKIQQKKDAVIGHALLAATWNRRNRSFSMGKSLAVSGVQIDPVRVAQLELMERLDQVKKNWKKLSYAEQFIHLWMSGAIAVIRKPQTWLKCGTSTQDRFLIFLSVVKNWCTDTSADDTCFYGFADAQLE